MDSYDEYDVVGALGDSDWYDMGQGVEHAGEETLRAIGNMVGNDTGTKIADTLIDGIHAGAEALADLISGL